jgi:hypothetical protein
VFSLLAWRNFSSLFTIDPEERRKTKGEQQIGKGEINREILVL